MRSTELTLHFYWCGIVKLTARTASARFIGLDLTTSARFTCGLVNLLGALMDCTLSGLEDAVAAVWVLGEVSPTRPGVGHDLLLLALPPLGHIPPLLRRLANHAVDVGVDPLDA